MKNSLRMIGISIILWLGLSIGLANAATLIMSSKDSATDTAPDNNIPMAMVGTSGTSGSSLAALDVSFATVELPNSANTVLASATSSSSSLFSNATKSSPTDAASLQAPGSINKVADAGKGSLASEYQTYAMLLVGLGLLGFSARRRSNIV
jgi:PEP-CTERM motif